MVQIFTFAREWSKWYRVLRQRKGFGRLDSLRYSHWLAPEVPAERVAALRDAYVATLKDPGLLADAQKTSLEIVPKSAEQLQALIKQTSNTPQAIRDKAAAILEWN